jgi:glutamate---cysteine ligase / carboxylate-amine ligase
MGSWIGRRVGLLEWFRSAIVIKSSHYVPRALNASAPCTSASPATLQARQLCKPGNSASPATLQDGPAHTLGRVSIEFRGSPSTTLGVELELGLVDRRTRALATAAGEVLAEVWRRGGPEAEAKVKHELFQCTVEVITGINHTVAGARRDLDSSLGLLRGVTDAHGLELIGSGSHPFSDWRDLLVSPQQRYAQLVESIQWPARRMAIHGVHFHVGVPSGAHAVAVVESIAFYLPLFLSVSASSPFWLGADTGMASSRTKVFEGLPTAGLPPRLRGWEDFEALMEGLLHAGVISSIREIWWDCRPHPDFGTVELRMCDGIASMDEVDALAALAQSLVTWLVEAFDAGEPLPTCAEWVVRENKWLASRHGIDSSFIVDIDGNRRPAVDLVLELVEQLSPTARRLGCDDQLGAVAGIVERGPSYRRQRQVVAEGGTLDDVVDALILEHRGGCG